MKTIALLLLFTALSLPAMAQEGYLLKPHQQKPGEVVRLLVNSSSTGGKMIMKVDGKSREGAMTIQRVRYLERRLVEDGDKVEYKIINDTIESTNALHGSQRRSRVAALTGQTVLGSRDEAKHIHLYLSGEAPDNVEAVELAELEAYENRNWFPARPVKIGETWKIDPGFVRHLILRDLGNKSSVEASMTLKEVVEMEGEKTAILTCKLQSVGIKGDAKQPEATASINATGTLHVSLATMLDRKLKIEGTLQSTNRAGDDLTTVTLPIKAESNKTIVK